jgi:anti-sigma regulatory factor (Ser/Thr protein kinase)
MIGLRLEQISEPDCVVIRAEGLLSLGTVASLRRSLLKALRDTGRVVVDVSRVELVRPYYVLVFPAVQAAAGGWPHVRLAIVGARLAFRAALAASRVDGYVPLVAGLQEARRKLDTRPLRVRQASRFDDTPAAPARSRYFIEDICTDWGLPASLREDAVLVGNELVSNAVEHAGSAPEVTLKLGPEGLCISVRDSSACQPVLRDSDRTQPRGRGIWLVQALAAEWGVREHSGGKTVWARLRTPS